MNFRPWIQNIWRASLASVAMGVLLSCQGAFQPRTQPLISTGTEDSALTGAAKVVYDPLEQITNLVPYTGTGQTELMREIRQQINPSRFNPELSKQISFARVVVHREGALAQPTRVQVTLGLRTAEAGLTRSLEFEGPLHVTDSGLLGNSGIPVKDGHLMTEVRFQLVVGCRDQNCDKVQLILQKINLNVPGYQAAKVSEETGLLYSRSHTNYRVSRSTGDGAKPLLEPLTTPPRADRRAIQESVEVLEGPAWVRIRVPSDKPDSDMLVVEGELLRTTDRTSELQRVEVGDRPLRGVLLGNNERGDIAVRVQRSNEQGETEPPSEVTIFFEQPIENAPPAAPEFKVVDSEIWASHPTAIVPVNFSDPKLSGAQQVTRQLEKFRVNPRVQEFMKYWTGESKYRQCGRGAAMDMKPRALNFLHKMKALVPYTTTIFQHLDVTPEILYISALESQFAITDGWIIEATKLPAGADPAQFTAAGPYQITEIAAKYLRDNRTPGLNFVTLPIGEDRSVNPNDDRSFFLPTTFAAAAYAKDLLTWFPDHPELWPLGYTEGQGALAVAMKCSLEPTPAKRASCRRSSSAGAAMSQRDRYRDATLDDIVNYKMAPCGKIDYILLYLALKFVGANMKEVKLDFDEAKVPKQLPKLFRPRQNLENLIPTMLKK